MDPVGARYRTDSRRIVSIHTFVESLLKHVMRATTLDFEYSTLNGLILSLASVKYILLRYHSLNATGSRNLLSRDSHLKMIF